MLETVIFYDDLKVILDTTFALAEWFVSGDDQTETKFQQNLLENSLEKNIGLRYSEDSFDIINLNNLLNNNKVVFKSENQLEVTFDNQEHQEQVKNRGQLKEISDTEDHHVIINQNANSNEVQKLQLVFKYPIKVASNKNVRKLKWISNYKEFFKEFYKIQL